MRSRIPRGEPPTIVAHEHNAPRTGLARPTRVVGTWMHERKELLLIGFLRRSNVCRHADRGGRPVRAQHGLRERINDVGHCTKLFDFRIRLAVRAFAGCMYTDRSAIRQRIQHRTEHSERTSTPPTTRWTRPPTPTKPTLSMTSLIPFQRSRWPSWDPS